MQDSNYSFLILSVASFEFQQATVKDIIEIKLNHKTVLDCLVLSFLKARFRALGTLQEQAHHGDFSSVFFSGLNLISYWGSTFLYFVEFRDFLKYLRMYDF